MTVDNEIVSNIGIDKIKFRIRVDGIDIKKLTSNSTIVATKFEKDGVRYSRWTLDGERLAYFKIKDNKRFSELEMTSHFMADSRPPYIIHNYYLTITVANIDGHNLYPKSYNEYNTYISLIAGYIFKTYGVKVNLRFIQVEAIEITKNIVLNEEFEKYNRVFALLMSFPRYVKNNPYRAIKTMPNSKVVKTETFLCKNKQIEYTIYNKIKQLNRKKNEWDVPENIARIEFRLMNNNQIKKYFGKTDWELLDQDDIEDVFYQIWEKVFLEPYADLDKGWEHNCDIKLWKLMRKMQNEYKNTWAMLLMNTIRNESEKNEVPFILDVQQIYKVIESHKSADKNWKRRIQAIENTRVKHDIYFNDDMNKINECISKIGMSE